jgi:hypothetical protein
VGFIPHPAILLERGAVMNLSSVFPAIISVSPTERDVNIGLRPNITVVFNQEMDSTQLSASSFDVYLTLIETQTDTAVPLQFVNFTGKILTVTPAVDLSPRTKYSVTVHSTLKSALGRPLGKELTWSFTTAQSALSVPTLLSPADGVSLVDVPAFYWSSVSYSEPVTYRVQVASSFTFSDSSIVGVITTSETSGVLGAALNRRQTYYWRVRAEAGSVVSAWSDFRAFYLGEPERPFPDPVVIPEIEAPFHVVRITPEDGLTNLEAWPEIKLYLSDYVDPGTVSGAVSMRYEPVDGARDLGSGLVELSVSVDSYVSGAISGSVITVAPASGIEIGRNTRYTLSVTRDLVSLSGDPLASEVSMYFTSKYVPLYGSLLGVRAFLGGLLADASDDKINFHIYRASLHANYLVLRFLYGGSGITQSQVRSYQQNQTYELSSYVELYAAIKLLEEYRFTLLTAADRARSLQGYEDRVGAQILSEIETLLSGYKKDLYTLEMTLLGNLGVPVPAVGVKSLLYTGGSTLPPELSREV